jgi:hypothetical protein
MEGAVEATLENVAEKKHGIDQQFHCYYGETE